MDDNSPLADIETQGVRVVSKPNASDKSDKRQRTLRSDAQNQASNPTPGNGPRVHVSFAGGPHDIGHESPTSDINPANVGLQSVGEPAAEEYHITDSPTATDNSPTGTSPVGNHPVDENHSIGSLKSELNSALLESHYEKNKSFLPRNEVQRLVCPESIKNYWLAYTERQFHEKCAGVINYVCGKRQSESRQARHVFVVLVFIEEPSLILDIMENNVYDEDLPLVRVNKQGTDFQLARQKDKKSPVSCFNKWTKAQRLSFESLQWQFMAPVFHKLPKIDPSSELEPSQLDDRDILPLIEYDSQNKYQGNSEVVRVKIHPAHCLDPGKNQSFALKSLKSEDVVGFRLEAKALVKIRPKPHLVSVLAAFKYQNKYHLLFRWADGGNLANLWSQEKPVVNYNLVCWLAEQCHGLVDGLDGIHNARLSESEVGHIRASSPPSSPVQNGSSQHMDIPVVKGDDQDCGRHGDIKPQNILWFQQDGNQYDHGVLKISDFGLTTFHSALTTKVPNNVPVTYTYAAPERDIDSDLSRPFDIWSLGCVYLEFITWLLLGPEELTKFKANRISSKDSRTKFHTDEFYSVYRDENDQAYATVKEAVTDWIKQLKGLSTCSSFLSEFLDYIQRKMMVVDKTERDTCGQVRKCLKDMYEKCKKERNFAIPSAVKPDGLATPVDSDPITAQVGTPNERGDESAGKEKHESIKVRVKQKLRYWCL